MEFTTYYCPHPQCTHYGRRGLAVLALIILSNIGGGRQPATARGPFSNMRR